ncbi:hypothetical protein ACMG5R_09000 [Staphylococcus warneri]
MNNALLITIPKNTVKTNDIIKKEHLDKDEYEAEPPAFFFF